MIKVLLISENTLFIDLLIKAIGEEKGFVLQPCTFKKSTFLQNLQNYEPTLVVFDIFSLTNAVIQRMKDFHSLAGNISCGVILDQTDLMYTKVKELVDVGFKGLFSRDLRYDKFIEGIGKLHEGDFFITNDIMKVLFNKSIKKIRKESEEKKDKVLSEREIDVLQAICEGKTSKETSEVLYLSPRTIQWHRANLMQKVGAKNTSHLIRYAIKNGYYQTLN